MKTELTERMNELDDIDTKINHVEERINDRIDKRMQKVDDLISDEEN